MAQQQPLVVSPEDLALSPALPAARPSTPRTSQPLVVDPADLAPARPAAPVKPTAKKPAGQFLGASTKPATLTRETRGGVLYESIPQITGAVGGALGGVAGAARGAALGTLAAPGVGTVSGATVGGATGAMTGAGAGGILGRYMQYLLQQTAGRTEVGRSFFGVPGPAAATDKSHPIMAELGTEATAQMENEMGGAILAAPLGFLRRGGFLKFNRDVMNNLRENAARGTRLSGPELATGTRIGAAGRAVQGYAAGSFFGGPIQQEVREQGSAAAVREFNSAIDLLSAGARTRLSAGTAAEAGMGAAKAGQAVVGQRMEALAQHANPVDMTAIKQAAVDELSRTIGPRIAAFPDIATNPKVSALVRAIRQDPTVIQRAPRPAVTLLLDTILEKTNSPALKMLREILGAEDSSPFKGVWEQAKVLRKGATPTDQLYAGKDAQRLSTYFNGLFRRAMAQASPEFDAVSSIYRRGANVLDSKAIETIFKTAVDKPEAVVALFTENPTRAAQLQRALKAVASRGPDAARGAAAYDLIRSTYLQQEIIQGGKAVPTDEAGMDKILQGVKQRLAAGRQSGVLTQWYSDPRGRLVLRNLDAVADLMSKRTVATTGRLRQIFEISRAVGAMVAAGGAAMTGRSIPGSAITTAAAWEVIPDVFVWAIHDPRAINWFIQGVQAENPTVASAAMIRFGELYRQELLKKRAEKNAPRPRP